jgi:hypothetical protein
LKGKIPSNERRTSSDALPPLLERFPEASHAAYLPRVNFLLTNLILITKISFSGTEAEGASPCRFSHKTIVGSIEHGLKRCQGKSRPLKYKTQRSGALIFQIPISDNFDSTAASLERLSFLKREGKVGYRWDQERADK